MVRVITNRDLCESTSSVILNGAERSEESRLLRFSRVIGQVTSGQGALNNEPHLRLVVTAISGGQELFNLAAGDVFSVICLFVQSVVAAFIGITPVSLFVDP